MRIAFDLDEILAEFTLSIFKYHNARFGTSYTEKNMTSFYYSEIWGKTPEETAMIMEDFFKTEYFAALPPIKSAIRPLHHLKKQGHELFVVTGRQSIVEKATHDWVHQHFSGIFRNIYMTNQFGLSGRKYRKVDFCKQIEASVLVDDHLEYAFECAGGGIDVLLFDYPYNRKPVKPLLHNITRVYNWKGVLAEISKIDQKLLRSTVQFNNKIH